jgi:hypothetical protein
MCKVRVGHFLEQATTKTEEEEEKEEIQLLPGNI